VAHRSGGPASRSLIRRASGASAQTADKRSEISRIDHCFRLSLRTGPAATHRAERLPDLLRSRHGASDRSARSPAPRGNQDARRGLPQPTPDQSDIDQVAAAIEPGSLAGILVYENVWAVPMWTAIDRSSARLVGAGRIVADDLIAALDAPDPA
jgi:hypothetical protein